MQLNNSSYWPSLTRSCLPTATISIADKDDREVHADTYIRHKLGVGELVNLAVFEVPARDDGLPDEDLARQMLLQALSKEERMPWEHHAARAPPPITGKVGSMK